MTSKELITLPAKVLISNYDVNRIYFNHDYNYMSVKDFLNSVVCFATEPFEDIKCKDVFELTGKDVIIMAPVNVPGAYMRFPNTGDVRMSADQMTRCLDVPKGLIIP